MTDAHEPPRSFWNIVALIATLGLAATVAVVAVTRSDRDGPAAGGSPTASASPSPSPTAAGKLAGRGPYLVYALASGEVFAYDTAAEQWVSMGSIDGRPAPRYVHQPGSGLVVAFATEEGTVWRVDREGLARVALLPVNAPDDVVGGTVSRDGRRLALTVTGVDELVIVNLANGRTSVIPRGTGSGNRYPDDLALVPIGWSLGGSLVYQLPVCFCEDGDPGMYIYDLEAERSTVLAPTSRDVLSGQFALSPDGQRLVWSDEDALRGLAAGRQSATVLRRAPDEEFFTDLHWSTDGASLLVSFADSPFGSPVRWEFADPETGDRRRDALGIPSGAEIVALLPGRLIVVEVGSEAEQRLLTIADGREKVVADEGSPVFLGWLR